MAETKMAKDLLIYQQRSENNSSGSGTKSSKKPKPKKVPQRGLGVAQLEKIRLEEQQKKDGVFQSNNPVLAPTFSQNLAPQADANSVFKINGGLDLTNKPLNLGQGSRPKLWNGEKILEGESFRFDHSGGYDFRSNNPNVIYESVPVSPAQNGIQRKELFQPQNSSSSLVRVSSGTSSSSVITYNQMEPPSNQSFYSMLCTSSKWPEEEKMIGIKRPYPFALEKSSDPTYPCKFPSGRVQNPACGSVESPSLANGGSIHFEPPKPLLREESASLSVMPAEMRAKKVTGKNSDLIGDFLSLAPPKPSVPHPTRELSDIGLKLQENLDGPSTFSFFPTSTAPNGQAANVTSHNGEEEEQLDLSLKL